MHSKPLKASAPTTLDQATERGGENLRQINAQQFTSPLYLLVNTVFGQICINLFEVYHPRLHASNNAKSVYYGT